jgi:hypothetical protein
MVVADSAGIILRRHVEAEDDACSEWDRAGLLTRLPVVLHTHHFGTGGQLLALAVLLQAVHSS